MTLTRLVRPATLLLPLILLTQSSCCTIAGYAVGSVIDEWGGPQRPDSVARAEWKYGGRAMKVKTRDGRSVVGVRTAIHQLSAAEVRDLYLELADHSATAPRLPLPGDTIRVSSGPRESRVRFDRFVGRELQPGKSRGPGLIDTTCVVASVFALDDFATPDAGAPRTVDWSSIDRVQWADGARLEDPRLLLPVLARIPTDPYVFTIRTESGAAEEFRSWEVERIDRLRWKIASEIGVVVGFGFDIFLLNGATNAFGGGGVD